MQIKNIIYKSLLKLQYHRFQLMVLWLLLLPVAVFAQDDCPEDYPSIGFEEENGSVCSMPGDIVFTIKESVYNNPNNKYCDYYISFDDVTDTKTMTYGIEIKYYSVKYSWTEIKAMNGVISHTYNESYCPNKHQWTPHLYIVSTCNSDAKKDMSFSVFLRQPGTADFSYSASCFPNPITFHNHSIGFQNEDCQYTDFYTWDFGDESAQKKINSADDVTHEYSCAGEYLVTLFGYANSMRQACGSDTVKKIVTVFPKPVIKTKQNLTICKGDNVPEVKTSELDVCKYDYYNNTTKKCEETDWCTKFPNDPVVTSITYTVSGDDIGLSASPYTKVDKIPSFKAVNESDVPKVCKVCVTPYNKLNCPGEPMCYTITVLPGAKINPISNVSKCDGSTVDKIVFSSPVSGVSFNWEVTDGDWQAIGMSKGSDNTDNIPQFTAKNSTNEPITVKIKVAVTTQTCGKTEQEFTITVNPIFEFTTEGFNPSQCAKNDGRIELNGLPSNYTLRVSYLKDGVQEQARDYTSDSNGKVYIKDKTTGGLYAGSYTAITTDKYNCPYIASDITLSDPNPPSKPEITSNSKVCIGENLELSVTNAEADVTDWVWSGPNGWSSTEKNPQRSNMSYNMAGTYTLVVKRNSCSSEPASVAVEYREDPSVTLNVIGEICNTKPFVIKEPEHVVFDWKTIPESQQTVKWELLNSSGDIINTSTDKYPSFGVLTEGDYKLRVEIGGFGCNGTLLQEKDFQVIDGSLSVSISTDKTDVCYSAPDNKIQLSSTVSSTKDVTYKWVATPEDGKWNYSDGSGTTKNPSVTFNNALGEYKFNLLVSNGCVSDVKSNDVEVNVHRVADASILREIKACTNRLYTISSEDVSYDWYGESTKEVEWTIKKKSSGDVYQTMTGEYPNFTITEPGDYTISVKPKNVYCGESQESVGNLKVHESDYVIDIIASAEVICETETLTFINKSPTDQGIVYKWSVEPDTGVSINDDTAAQPVIIFSEFGTYKITAATHSDCGDEDKTFNLTVRKNPSVTIDEIPSYCINEGAVLETQSYTHYYWYNTDDENKTVKWTISPSDGGSISSDTELHPKVTFSKSGEYTLTVTTDYKPCSSAAGSASGTVKVFADYVLNIDTPSSDVCENSDIQIVNNTEGDSDVTYTWTEKRVSDGTVVETRTERAPKFTFNEYGEYSISISSTDEECFSHDLGTPFTVKVHKAPSVTLLELPDICTGNPIAVGEYATYFEYYDAANPTWSVLNEQGQEVTEGVIISDVHSKKPTITFSTEGKYVIKVSLAATEPIECGNPVSVEQPITVIDNEAYLTISHDKDILCVGDKVTFTNSTRAEFNFGEYVWTLPDGAEFVDNTDEHSEAPVVKFNKNGVFQVSATAKNICGQREYKLEDIKVHKVSSVNLNKFSVACTNTTLNLADSVRYDWDEIAINKTYTWSVSPATIDTPTDGATLSDTDVEAPSISFSKSGKYELKISISDGYDLCTGSREDKTIITVYDADLQLDIKPDTLAGCVPFKVSYTNKTISTQDIEYLWSVTPETGWSFVGSSASSDSPTIEFSTRGKYNILVSAKNFCINRQMDFSAESYADVTYSLADMADVCGEYTFDATASLIVDGDESFIKSVEWSVHRSTDDSPDNYEYLVGDKGTLRPKIHIKKFGTYTISATIEAICNTETVSRSIKIDEPIDLQITAIDALCPNIRDEFNQNPVQLVATPSGDEHKWSVTGAPAEWIEAETGKFYPNAPGMYEATYYVKVATCDASGSIPVEVREYPELTMGDDIRVCYKDIEPRVLEETGAVPTGGVWKGNNVTLTNDVYYYNPPLLIGSDTLIYTITDEFGCKNRDGIRAYVMPLPKTGFENNIPCMPDPVIFTPEADLTENKFFLDYGDETTGTILQHLYDTIGVYDVKLIVTASSGCVDSLTKTITVEKVPDQKIMLSERSGCSVFSPDITPIYTYIDSVNTTFLWTFGDFKTDDKMIPDSVGFSADVEDVTYPITFTVENLCGSTTEESSVHVYALPKSIFEAGRHGGCSPVPIDMINNSTGSTVGMKYKWDFGDGTGSEERFPTHKFTSPLDSVSVYNIKLTTENLCGVDSAFRDVTITSSVIKPQVYSVTPTACVGLPVCFMDKTIVLNPDSTVIQYMWDFGNGDRSNTNCTVFNDVGPYTVKLTIGTECGSVETDSLTIKLYSATDIAVKAQTINCAKDTVSPLLIANRDSIKALSWSFGDGSYSSADNPKHVYRNAGDYMIKVTAMAANFGSCLSKDSVMVNIKPLPNPTIEPIMYDSCGPILYAPNYSEDFYIKVDYKGDGHAISVSEFLYENHTLEPVIYYPHFYFEDQFGCKSEQEGRIRIYPQPKAMFSISEVENERPEKVHLKNESFGSDNCVWVLPYSGEIPSCNDTVESFMYNDEKDMTIKVSNIYGCTDTYTLQYQPVMKGLFFPNTFAPNGITEAVRTFNGVGIGLQEYELEIFDLYGNLIFRTTSLDADGKPDHGWDGCDKSGNMMPQDVYTWKAKAIFIDGSAYPYGNSRGPSEVTLHRGSVLLLHK